MAPSPCLSSCDMPHPPFPTWAHQGLRSHFPLGILAPPFFPGLRATVELSRRRLPLRPRKKGELSSFSPSVSLSELLSFCGPHVSCCYNQGVEPTVPNMETELTVQSHPGNMLKIQTFRTSRRGQDALSLSWLLGGCRFDKHSVWEFCTKHPVLLFPQPRWELEDQLSVSPTPALLPPHQLP